MASNNSPAGSVPPQSSAMAMLAGFLGWTLDAFDFFLVVMAYGQIAKEFGKTDSQMAWSITLTLAFRPVGAFIFGLVADRYGRRLPLMVDLVLFSVVEVLSGLTHNFHTFLLLRCIFGIAMGGEWGVGASLTMEKVPPKLRGILSGLLQEGYAMGFLLAALAYWLVYPRWGWRPLFFIGGLPALLAIFVRFGVTESQAWREEKAGNWTEMFTGIASHWRIFLYLVLLMTMMNLSSHGTQDLYPRFLETAFHLDPNAKIKVTAIAMVGAIVGGLFFGALSDRIGRRLAMVLAFLGAIIIVPLWAMPTKLPLLMLGGFALQFMVQGAWGIIPAHICELAPPAVRGFLPGFAYQMGNLAASYIARIETSEAANHGYRQTLMASAWCIFVLAAIVTALGKERRGMVFGTGGSNATGQKPTIDNNGLAAGVTG